MEDEKKTIERLKLKIKKLQERNNFLLCSGTSAHDKYVKLKEHQKQMLIKHKSIKQTLAENSDTLCKMKKSASSAFGIEAVGKLMYHYERL